MLARWLPPVTSVSFWLRKRTTPFLLVAVALTPSLWCPSASSYSTPLECSTAPRATSGSRESQVSHQVLSPRCVPWPPGNLAFGAIRPSPLRLHGVPINSAAPMVSKGGDNYPPTRREVVPSWRRAGSTSSRAGVGQGIPIDWDSDERTGCRGTREPTG